MFFFAVYPCGPVGFAAGLGEDWVIFGSQRWSNIVDLSQLETSIFR